MDGQSPVNGGIPPQIGDAARKRHGFAAEGWLSESQLPLAIENRLQNPPLLFRLRVIRN
jgi:hypothetical protein